MSTVLYRESLPSDIPAMARIRAAEWGDGEYWCLRISRYLNRELHPREALLPRISYVAVEAQSIVGFIAGHLTRRYRCDGELEWINVLPERRGTRVALGLLCRLAAWFAAHDATRICVDVDPTNRAARRFYTRHGAQTLNEHWLVWNDITKLIV